jgi:hypothetical protein
MTRAGCRGRRQVAAPKPALITQRPATPATPATPVTSASAARPQRARFHDRGGCVSPVAPNPPRSRIAHPAPTAQWDRRGEWCRRGGRGGRAQLAGLAGLAGRRLRLPAGRGRARRVGRPGSGCFPAGGAHDQGGPLIAWIYQSMRLRNPCDQGKDGLGGPKVGVWDGGAGSGWIWAGPLSGRCGRWGIRGPGCGWEHAGDQADRPDPRRARPMPRPPRPGWPQPSSTTWVHGLLSLGRQQTVHPCRCGGLAGARGLGERGQLPSRTQLAGCRREWWDWPGGTGLAGLARRGRTGGTGGTGQARQD